VLKFAFSSQNVEKKIILSKNTAKLGDLTVVFELFSRNLTSGSQYPDIFGLPGIMTRKSKDIRVTIPGDFFTSGYRDPVVKVCNLLVGWTSGYCDPEVKGYPGTDTRKST